jgi:hypothetical protein
MTSALTEIRASIDTPLAGVLHQKKPRVPVNQRIMPTKKHIKMACIL